MKPTIIAAMAQNRVIGKDNQLIWHLPDDLKHFKHLTSGHHVIMGRKTYQSMGKPLPNRVNIIITRQKDFQADGCQVAHSISEALALVENDPQPFIIGGAEIYQQSLDYASKMELTLIDGEFEGDTYFPEFDSKLWKLARAEKKGADEKHAYSFEYQTYLKIRPEDYASEEDSFRKPPSVH